MSALGLSDNMPFGKFKGRSVGEIAGANPGYLCWLRENRKSDGKPSGFTKEVHDRLDAAIKINKSLSAKYTPWNIYETKPLDAATLSAKFADAEGRQTALDELDAQRTVAYSQEWGSW